MRRSLPVLIALVLLFLTGGCNLNQKADFQKGLDAYMKEDYATALREFKPLAEQGDAEAQFFLGTMYFNGRGVPENLVYAHMRYNIAASTGHWVAAKARDVAAKKMTPAQIEKAQELVAECEKRKYKECY
tara:strand:- start:145 stop:534 length:390 start_codon:yes stop_codon:yes gene_type:complete